MRLKPLSEVAAASPERVFFSTRQLSWQRAREGRAPAIIEHQRIGRAGKIQC